MTLIGQQLVAPEGFAALQKGKTYHFLGRHGEESNGLFVSFDEKPGAYLVVLEPDDLELAISSKSLLPVEKPSKFPPWLARYEGTDPLVREERRRGSPTRSLESIADERLTRIRPLLDSIEVLLAAKDPEQAIKRAARKLSPKLNEGRTVRNVLTYLAFGRNKLALLPAYCNIGTWAREPLSNQGKPGRPSKHGILHGRRMTPEMREKCVAGFVKFAKLGVYMTTIWTMTLTKIFGCKVQTQADTQKHFYHPAGHSYPSFWQFYRAVRKQFGLERIQVLLYGAARVRRTKTPSRGRFSEAVSNLLQRVEGDAYYLAEVPKGMLEGQPMPPLYVVRLRCVTSGLIVGIGFGIGKERADAYRDALLCMAIPKEVYCGWYGVRIAPEDWPSIGFPSWLVVDRGPGATMDLLKDMKARIPIRELTPSYEGQSKATIESSNPRSVKIDGKPTFIQSSLNYVELARREIRRSIRDNRRILSEDRRTPAMIRAGVKPWPLSIWNYLDARFRTDAHEVPFEDAARNLMTPLELKAHEDGIYVHDMRYDSIALRETGLHNRVLQNGVTTIRGYMPPLVTRLAYAEVGGKLVPVDAMLPIRDHEKQLYLSLAELEDLARIRADLREGLMEHRAAVDAEQREAFEHETGKRWDAGTRKGGRPRRTTPAAREEYSHAADIINRRKHA